MSAGAAHRAGLGVRTPSLRRQRNACLARQVRGLCTGERAALRGRCRSQNENARAGGYAILAQILCRVLCGNCTCMKRMKGRLWSQGVLPRPRGLQSARSSTVQGLSWLSITKSPSK